jgi:hypothetical protein
MKETFPIGKGMVKGLLEKVITATVEVLTAEQKPTWCTLALCLALRLCSWQEQGEWRA